MITRSPVQWMLLPVQRYAQFSGRAPRAEYWWFVLFSILVGIPVGMIDAIMGIQLAGPLLSLGLLLPSLAVSVRRLHDLDRTGWWVLAPLLIILPTIAIAAVMGAGGAIAGLLGSGEAAGAGAGGAMIVLGVGLLAGGIISIVMLIWYCSRGTAGDNRYGPDPLAEAANPTLYYS
ncbi:DUF805 domain-containing protein [Sandarakinorhabdus oryzae]|uniref:DUF805 domain-containing protein n=1 Tax=Sandarakinorhabdus oryzae TaxID=2675220 RepID=UPI0012E2ED34|nr:DUF805 domain-containing protein [Sandarakinorhabdus oryzae]